MADPFAAPDDNSNMWNNLMQFGLATMASSNERDGQGLLKYPSTLGAVGAGGLAATQSARERAMNAAQVRNLTSESQSRQIQNALSLEPINMRREAFGMPRYTIPGIPQLQTTPQGGGDSAGSAGGMVGQQAADGQTPAANSTGTSWAPNIGMSKTTPQTVAYGANGKPQAQADTQSVLQVAAGIKPPSSPDEAYQAAGWAQYMGNGDIAKSLSTYALAGKTKQSEYQAVPQTIDTGKPTVLNGQMVAGQTPSGTPFINPAAFGGGQSQAPAPQPQQSQAPQPQDQRFQRSMGVVDQNEGGYTALDGSSGAPAIYGINAKAYPTEFAEAKQITDTQGEAAGKAYATNFYKNNFWDKYKIGDLPAGVQTVVMDGVVNHYPGFAEKLVDAAKKGANSQQLLQMRRAEYQRLNQANPDKFPTSQVQQWNQRLGNVAAAGGAGPEASGAQAPRNASFMKPEGGSDLPPGMMQAGPNPIEHKKQEAEAGERGKNIAEADTGVASILSRLDSAFGIISKMENEADKVPYGFKVEDQRNAFNQLGLGEATAYDRFHKWNENLFVQELPAIVAGAGGRIDIPLVNSIQAASTVPMDAQPATKKKLLNDTRDLLQKVRDNALTKYKAETGQDFDLGRVYKTPDDIRSAFQSGILTRRQATQMLVKGHGFE